ncbi:MAG TPA: enolase C-terminal domain-like protein [Marmoricola sp.]|nr:enolase C-terminal domain-like protein [Marmoricola sp.]
MTDQPTASGQAAGAAGGSVGGSVGDATVEALSVAAYTVPTDAPEADGTWHWDRTTLVVVHARALGVEGLGYTYGPASVCGLVQDVLAPQVVGLSVADVPRAAVRMGRCVRNIGRDGAAALAASAVDCALWDLKARVSGLPLHRLLGRVRDTVPVYGSGGFTTYDEPRLAEQLTGWVEDGCRWVKIKIAEACGTREDRDAERIRQVRRVVGDEVGVFVDANGGYTAKQAIRMLERVSDVGVTWFEEPVSSDDLAGMRVVRESVPADVAAGEYGYDLQYFERMCASGAVDCLQVDVTRCGGITGWLRAVAVADAFGLEVSAHCAPHLSAAPAAATPNFRHLEWFHDHVRIERDLFCDLDGLQDGNLPLPELPGNGLVLDRARAEPFRVA